MQLKLRRLFLIAVLLLPVTIFAQVLEPVKWSFEKNKIEEGKYELFFKASIDDNWHVYDTWLPAGNISLPTVFDFETSENVNLVDSINRHSEVLEEIDQIAGVMTRYYANEAVFSQIVEISDLSDSVTVILEFMA
nr:hypothetical protein [Salinivirgaceae bacterium]